jgi:hypothetical protein
MKTTALLGTGFYSSLYGVHVSSGLGAFDLDPTRAGDQEGMDLGAGKASGLFFRDNQLYVSRSGAIGVEATPWCSETLDLRT